MCSKWAFGGRKDNETTEDIMAIIQKKYNSLTPRGKFAAGCTLGFVGSRVAVNTAVKCFKIGAAAFIA
jgi:hypothetical protein